MTRLLEPEMGVYMPPSEEEQMELARRASGGHPVGSIRGKQDIIASLKNMSAPARKTAMIEAAKAEMGKQKG
jgi:hypothetical protein